MTQATTREPTQALAAFAASLSLDTVPAPVQACAKGRVLATHRHAPRGAPENPLTRAQIEQKFRTYARARLPETKIAQIIDMVYGLEALPAIRSLIATLRA